MNIKNVTNCFNHWLKDKSIEEITHSRKYAKYEIEKLLADQSEAELILRKKNVLICRCRYSYVINRVHSSDNVPHLFEFEAIGYAELKNNAFIEYTYFDYIITYR